MTDGIPTLGEVRAYLDLPVGVLSDDDLSRMWDAARAQQANTCRPIVDDAGVPVTDAAWPATLVQALLRRVQRMCATRNLPLGYASPEGQFGPARLLNFDAIIEELEGPYRKVVFS